MVVACLVKEIQLCTELRDMVKEGVLSQTTVDNIIKTKFESPLPNNTDDEDVFLKGEFDVIKELLEKLPGAKEGKATVWKEKCRIKE